MTRRTFALVLALAAFAGGCGDRTPKRPTVVVFAAASLSLPLTEIGERYEAETGVRVVLNFAASSTLARQIEHGAEADVFVSANPQWTDHLIALGRIEPDATDLARNRLALVAPAGQRMGREAVPMERRFDLAAAIPGRIALADPEHVPAGIYSRQALEWLGWWDDVSTRMVPAQDVRDALRLVEMGEVDAGIVYASDAKSSDRVHLLGLFPVASHEPIRYRMGTSPDAGDAARRFAEHLRSEQTAARLRQSGFECDGG